MPVREFEIFHGIVLTKLLRSESPLTLRLVETKPKESWSTYTVNDTVDLLVTHSKSPRVIKRDGGATAWTFQFSQNQLRQMDSELNGRAVWVALVCGSKKPLDGNMHVCLLDPEQIAEVVDLGAQNPSVTVRKPTGKAAFRVLRDRQERFTVRLSRLDKWKVPGG